MYSLNPEFFNDPFTAPVFANEKQEATSTNNEKYAKNSNINSLRKDLMTNMFNKSESNGFQMPFMGESLPFPWMCNQCGRNNNDNDNCDNDCDNDHQNDCRHDCKDDCNQDCKHDCKQDCKMESKRDYSDNDNCCDNDCTERRNNGRMMNLAIANIERHCFDNLYNQHDALKAGTLFSELELPFTGSRCNLK